MNTTVYKRRHTSFRLPEYLLDKLKAEAKKHHQSLNGMVEMTLLDAMFCEPNAKTRAAMEECRSGVELPRVDTSSMDAFIKSIEQ